MKQTDENWTAYINQVYGHDRNLAGHYDMVLDTGRLGYETTVKVILTSPSLGSAKDRGTSPKQRPHRPSVGIVGAIRSTSNPTALSILHISSSVRSAAAEHNVHMDVDIQRAANPARRPLELEAGDR